MSCSKGRADFSINKLFRFKFVHYVVLDVPVGICGVVFGSPCMYDERIVITREQTNIT